MATKFTAAILAFLLDTGLSNVTKSYRWVYTPPEYYTDPNEKCIKTETIEYDDGTPTETNTSNVPIAECCLEAQYWNRPEEEYMLEACM